MKIISQKIKTIFIVTICAILYLPMAYLVGGTEYTNIYGVDVQHSLPDIHEESFINKQFQNDFENWWQSHFYGRKFALKLKNQIYDWVNFGVIHSGYGDSVIQGKKHHLFEKAYFVSFDKCQEIPEELNKIQTLQEMLQQKSIELFFVLAPNKVVTYKEFMPNRYAYFYNQNCNYYDKIESKLKYFGIPVYNTQRLMNAIKKEESYPPFNTTGTHWNYYGAGRAIQEAAKEFGWELPKIIKIESKNTPYRVERDIADLLNLIFPYKDTQEFYSPVFEKRESLKGKTVIIGNSFSSEFRILATMSHVVEPKNLSSFENRFLSESDIESIKDASRIIFVYTDIAIVDSQGQLYKHINNLFNLFNLINYNFSTTNNENQYVKLSGFFEAEHWGRWTNGEVSEIYLNGVKAQDIIIEFDTIAFIADNRKEQNVEVLINGKKITDWHYDAQNVSQMQILSIPSDMIESGKITITFMIHNPVSPLEVGHSGDGRKLAIGFKTMKIKDKIK